MTARLYLVTNEKTSDEFFVKATNQTQAIRHVFDMTSALSCAPAQALQVAQGLERGMIVLDAIAPKSEGEL